jgi:DNA-binding MarR family transcriptional regulator
MRDWPVISGTSWQSSSSATWLRSRVEAQTMLHTLMAEGPGPRGRAAGGVRRYASTHPERLTDHPLRAAIVATAREHPGILLSQLRRRIGCSAGTIQYHLQLLECSGAVACLRSSRRCWVFPQGVQAADQRAVAMLRNGRMWTLAQSLLRQPRLTKEELASGLSISPRTLREHLDRLAREGLVSVASGDPRTFTPSEHLLRLLGPPPSGGSARPAFPA